MNEFKIDFIGLGAPKCGTTTIAKWLEGHPEIDMPIIKETNYFAKYHAPPQEPRDSYKERGIKGYKEIFRKRKINFSKKVGEFSTHYIFDPFSPKRIKKHFPDVKLIVSFRNPQDMIESYYNHNKYFNQINIKCNIKEAIRKYPYIEQAKHYKNLCRYLSLFPKENIHIILFDDFVREPKKVCKRLYEFLGVDNSFRPPSLYKKSNPTRERRFKLIHNLLVSAPPKIAKYLKSYNLYFIINLMNRLKVEKFIIELRDNLNTKPIQKERMDRETRKYVLSQVIDDIENLESFLGRDLSHWKK